jgi:alkaline phosphatase
LVRPALEHPAPAWPDAGWRRVPWRADHAAHNADPGAHLHEILMYNEMVEYVKDWAAAHPNTVVISVRACARLFTGGLMKGAVYRTHRWPTTSAGA